MSGKALLGSTVSLLLAGCVVGPNYQAPRASAPVKWTTPLGAGETDAPLALADWWRSFNDADLDRLETAAVESNLTLRAAEQHVREARAERDFVAGGRWPSAGTTVAYSNNDYGANNFPPLPPGSPITFNLYSVGFDAAWELDLFGGVHRAVEASNAQLGAAQYARRDVLISVLAEVARSYIEARGYQERLKITRRNISAQADIVELTRSRYRSGLSTDLDVEQATALLTATQAQLPALESGYAQSVHELSVLVGAQPGALIERMSRVQPIPLTPPVIPVGLPAELLRRRPDVERAERELAAATAEIGVARADLFPKFSLTGGVGLVSISESRWLEYASRYWAAGPGIEWNLLEGGRLRANVRVQQARAAQAFDSYRQTVLTALEDAEDALVGYAKEQSRRQSLAQSERASAAALHLATELYRSGLTDFLTVLDSERTLYGAQDALVESTRAASLDLVQLYKALGGGWEQQPAPSATAVRQMSSGP